MTVQVEKESQSRYTIILAVMFIAAGIFAYSYFAQMPTLYRAGMFIGGLIAAILVIGLSSTGRRLFDFFGAAFQELRRVIWPTRAETIQMTGVVFAFVIVMAILMWIIDTLIEYGIFSILLGWK